MRIIQSAFVDTPIGTLQITADDRGITSMQFTNEQGKDEGANDVLAMGKQQIAEYFAGERREFHDLPLVIVGSDFTRSVWEQVMQVPYGATRTYGQIATSLRREDASRAVGTAVGRNTLAILIPCHRILPANGSIGGFAWGEERKKWLLEHEKKCTD